MRRDELAGRELRPRLAAPRTDFPVCGLAVAELRDNFVITIEDADLAIEIRAHHPFALHMKVARHAEMGFVLDGLEMFAIQGERLDAAIAAIGNYEHGIGASRVDPLAMRIIEFAVGMAGGADFAEEFSILRKTQHVVGTIAVANVEVAVGRESDVGRHEINRAGGVSGVFARIAVRPDSFSGESGFHDFAAIDVAVIEKLLAVFAAQVEAVCATAEFFAKRANKFPIGIEDDDGFAAHARRMNRVGDVDETLIVLADAVRVAPDHSFRRNEPVVNTFVGVRTGTDDR